MDVSNGRFSDTGSIPPPPPRLKSKKQKPVRNGGFFVAIFSGSCNIHRASSVKYQNIRKGGKLVFLDTISLKSN